MRFLLVGGLGNQLGIFHAAAYAAQETGRQVELVRLRPATGDTVHPSKLEQLVNLETDGHVILKDVNGFSQQSIDYWVRSFFRGLLDSPAFHSIQHLPGILTAVEEGFSHFSLSSAWVKGHFQTYMYRDLLKTAPEIRVQFPSLWFFENVESGRLAAEFSGAIHIRRGDFKNLSRSVGLLSPKYYEQALNQAGLAGEKIAVYTDEPESAVKVLDQIETRANFTLIKTSEASDAEILISFSKHRSLILANSSFSLWAGILAAENGSKVTRPSINYVNRPQPARLWPEHWSVVDAHFE